MDKVYEYIDENRNSYISWLKKACEQPSVSAQNQGMIEMKELVKYFLEGINVEIQEIKTDGYPIIYGEINTSKSKTLTFYNHYDVQPVEPLSEWLSNPFEPEIRNDKLFARGIADNKGNLIARICAVHAYQKVYGELPINLKFILEGEEEIGSPNLDFFASKFPDKLQTDGIVWEGGMRGLKDKRLHVELGVKGICYVELICKGAKTDLHSAEASIIENPAWRLVWALNTIKNDKEEILIKGFYDDIVPLSKKEEEFIHTIDIDEKELKKTHNINNFLNNETGDKLKEQYISSPTCTICGINSGYIGEGSKTVLPSIAKAKLDFRLVPEQTPEKVAKLLRNHLNKHGFKDIEVKQSHGHHPFNTNPDDPFVDKVLKSIGEVYKEPPMIFRNSAGSSPLYKMLKNTNIPAVQIGVANTQSNYHGPNENINISDYLQGIKVIANILYNVGLNE